MELGQSDFNYSTLSSSGKSVPIMAKPLPCWCRGRELVPLEKNPLIQWVKRQRQGELNHKSREASRGMGRGRPLATNGLSSLLSDFSDDDTDYVGAYWQQQTGLVEPSLDTAEPTQPVEPAASTVSLSEGQSTCVGDLGSPPPSRLEQHMPSAAIPEVGLDNAAASLPQARRGIAPSWKARLTQMLKSQREELPSGTAAPRNLHSGARASRLPLTSVPRDQPKTSRSHPCQPPSHAGDAAEGATATSGGSCRNLGDEPTRRRTRAPVREVRVRPRRLDPSEFHNSDLNLWSNSWTRIRHTDNASDDEYSEEDEEEDEEAFLEQGDSPSSAAPQTPSPTVEEPTNPQDRDRSQLLEIKGLLKITTDDAIYDVVATYISVSGVEIFHADGAVGARLTLTQPYPIPWMTKCIEEALLFAGEPGPLVVTSTPTSKTVDISEGDAL